MSSPVKHNIQKDLPLFLYLHKRCIRIIIEAKVAIMFSSSATQKSMLLSLFHFII